jgi:transposase-like protein
VKDRVQIRYSEAFKLQVVHELESGKFSSFCEASAAYGIKRTMTVQRWTRTYGRVDLLGKVVRVETVDEVNELKALRKRVRELESALSDAHLGKRFDDAYLKIACRAAGIEDVEDFKKKHATKP